MTQSPGTIFLLLSEEDGAVGFSENNFEPPKDIHSAEQERDFFNQCPSDTRRESDAVQLQGDAADHVRNSSARHTANFPDPLPRPLAESQSQAGAEGQHGQIRARVDVHCCFEGPPPMGQDHVRYGPPNKTVVRPLPLIAECDYRVINTSIPRCGILAIRGLWRGYFFRMRLSKAERSWPLPTTRRLTRTMYWLAYRLVSSFKKASKFALITVLKYSRKIVTSYYFL